LKVLKLKDSVKEVFQGLGMAMEEYIHDIDLEKNEINLKNKEDLKKKKKVNKVMGLEEIDLS
jgi:hypothetical protein